MSAECGMALLIAIPLDPGQPFAHILSPTTYLTLKSRLTEAEVPGQQPEIAGDTGEYALNNITLKVFRRLRLHRLTQPALI